MGLILESTLVEVVCALLLVCWAVYKNVTQLYSHWTDRGVPHVPPAFPFGSLKDMYLGREHFGEIYKKFYENFKGDRYFGVYESRKPNLVVRDPELIKCILTKDFSHFTDRFVFPINAKVDHISLHLFNMSGQQWKNMRTKLTPTFSSGKMKLMFLLMVKCGEQLRGHVGKEVKNNPVVDVKDVLARFTMDIIASCAFGLEIDSLNNKNSDFFYFGMKIFKPSLGTMLRRMMFSFMPFTTKIFTSRFTPQDVSQFLTTIVQDTVEYREKNSINRNDFLDLLIKVRNNTSLQNGVESSNGISELKGTKNKNDKELTINEIAAQCFIFFAAGFETASSTTTFCLYELACNQGVQDKLNQEVEDVLTKYDGQITYQALQEMTYMDQVINETLRRYSSLATLTRTCSEQYKIPNSDVIIEKGQRVTIPTFAIHHDPEYYPDPYRFDPERFAPEKVKERHPYLHLPFGEGPRMCIGMRFGLLQTKVGLTEMISNFQFDLSSSTQIPVQIHKAAFITQPEKPILLHLTPRKPEFQ